MEYSILQNAEIATRLDEAAERRAEAAIGFLERLVRHASVVGEERGAQQELADELDRLGFGIGWLPIEDELATDPAAGVPPLPYAGREVLVARRGGPGGPGARSLLINGHLDVVPPGDERQWTQPPFNPVRRDGWLHGRGAGDMKAGFAMVTLAVAAADEALPGFPAAELTIVGVVEEECTGNGTLASVRAGIAADAVVLPEPTALDLMLSGEGVLWLEIEVRGRPGHAEAASSGVSALDQAQNVIAALRDFEVAANTGGAARHDLNIGVLEAGDWISSVPASARIGARVGFPLGWTVAEAEERVRAAIATAGKRDPWLAENPPLVRAVGLRAAGYEIDAGDELVETLSAAHLDAHGTRPATVASGATTDARHYRNELGLPVLCYGPRARDIHGIDEAVEVASIVDGARTLARFMVAWLGPDAGGAP